MLTFTVNSSVIERENGIYLDSQKENGTKNCWLLGLFFPLLFNMAIFFASKTSFCPSKGERTAILLEIHPTEVTILNKEVTECWSTGLTVAKGLYRSSAPWAESHTALVFLKENASLKASGESLFIKNTNPSYLKIMSAKNNHCLFSIWEKCTSAKWELVSANTLAQNWWTIGKPEE